MNHKITISLAGLALAITACSSDEQAADVAEQSAAPVADATQHITEDYIREVMIEISSDEYEGRGPATKGDLMTREFIIKEMQDIGLQPAAADGGWEQPFQMVSVNTLPPEEGWTFAGHGESVSFEYYEDFTMNGQSGSNTRRRECRSRFCRVWHSGAGVWLGRLQEHRRYRQDRFADEQRPGLGR